LLKDDGGPAAYGFVTRSLVKARQEGDGRSKHFIETYGVGELCYKLKAMPASTLLMILQQAIEKYMDVKAWNKALAYERFVNEQASIMFDPETIKERFLASLNGQKQLPEPEKVKTSLVFDDLFEDED
jgi:hypothetical protein